MNSMNSNETQLLFINGPNLNMLGNRETEIYGTKRMDEINQELRNIASEEKVGVNFFQSNHEGQIVDKIQEARGKYQCIVINAAAFTHYSVAIYDALKAVNIPFVEVHLSNIYAREEFRHKSLLSPIARGGIFGFGEYGYKMALYAAIDIIK